MRAAAETPLLPILRGLIETDGPISVATYMSLCLAHPEHGYYTGDRGGAGDPFGAAGDFTTAPEVSQMFGEIVGAFLHHLWREQGAPGHVRLVELGPGRGTLAADMLRTLKADPAFLAAATLHLVETSPVLRARQAATLRDAPLAPRFHATLDEVSEGPLFLVANELFDCLPVRQFVRDRGRWRERVVGLAPDGSLAFGLGTATADGPDAPDGSVMERSPAATALAASIARRIAADGGAALVIDYGGEGPALSDTLQAVSRHAFADPLDRPGAVDLTMSVDFGALKEAARAEGAAVFGPIRQGAFLVELGLLERAGRLGAHADAASRAALTAAVDRLAGPTEMGTLFKVLLIAGDGRCPFPFAPAKGVQNP